MSDTSAEWYFHEAISKQEPAEREAWLVSVLGSDPAKLQRVRELIADFQDASWLDDPPKVVLEAKRFIEDQSGTRLGPFLLTELIDSGGMGDVYRARQLEPVERTVALKIIRRGVDHQSIVQRFHREKQMLATMEHPNIARIIDAGVTNLGFSYIAMEYVDGVDLLEYCRTHGLGIKSRIQLILQCCRAIQHAHQKGVIHRDIKPNNVLVTQVDNEPMIKLIDFGIAKADRSLLKGEADNYPNPAVSLLPASLTRTGCSPGTPPYMSPEQFLGETELVDSRSDIYSIGAMLYLLLTEQEPFDRSSLAGRPMKDIGRLVQETDPMLPSLRAPELASVLRGDLDAIVRKAMHRNMDKRYESVSQLSEDLRRYLAGETVSCNRGGFANQAWKFAKRNRLLVGSVSIALCGLILASIGLFVGWVLAVKEKRGAVGETRIANLLSASLRVQRQEYRDALEGLKSTAQGIEGAAQRLDVRLLRSQIPQSSEIFAQVAKKIYYGLSVDSRGLIASGTNDSTLALFDAKSGQEYWVHGTGQGEINGLGLSPDEKYLATAGDDGTVQIWDLDTKSLSGSLRISPKSAFQVGWVSKGRFLVTVSNEPNAKIWSFPECELIGSVDSAGVDLECVAVSKDGHFAFGDYRGTVRIGRLDSTEPSDLGQLPIQTVFLKYQPCSALAFSDSGRFLAVGLNSGYLSLLCKTASGYQALEQIRFPVGITSLSFSSDEKRLAIGDRSGGVHVLEIREEESQNSKLHFTERFFEVHYEQLGGKLDVQQRQARLSEFIESIDPPDAFESLPLAIDRVVVSLKEPLQKAVFEEQFARHWLGANSDPAKDRFETPMRIYREEKKIDLIFEDRLNHWVEPSMLKEQRRLRSWVAHTKRVSGVSWGGPERSLFSFSEDLSIRKLRHWGQADSILEANAHDLYPITSDELLLLDKDKDRVLIHRYEPRGDEVSSVQMDSSEQNETYHVVQGALGCFGGKSGGDGALESRYWGLGRLDPARNRFVEMSQVPQGFELVHLIGCPRENQWLGRFSRTEDSGKGKLTPAFLALWDGQTKRFVWQSEANTEAFRHSDLSPDGKFLVYEKNATIFGVDVQSGLQTVLVNEPELSVSFMAYSPDSRLLAVVLNKERMIRVYRVEKTQLLKKCDLREYGGQTIEVAWSKEQGVLLSISRDGRLRTYDLDSQRLSTEIALPLVDPKHLKISPDEQAVFVSAHSGAVLRLPCPKLD